MNRIIYNRILDEANYIINNDMTIREVASIFNISKSTVHKDVSKKLYFIDKDMSNKVSIILKKHTSIKHINGGEGTKRKFLLKNNNIAIKNC